MTKHNMTDRTDDHGKRGETHHRSRAIRSRIVRIGLLSLVLVFALGNVRCPVDRAPTIACRDFAMRIDPGTCQVFQNPCRNGVWEETFTNPEGFELDPTEEQRGRTFAVSIRTIRAAGQTTREVCVGAGSPLLVNEDIGYGFSRGVNYGIGSLILTTAPLLTVEATAIPSSIDVGDSSQLVANPSGGVPPYFYSWAPSAGLNDDDIAAPIATPNFTTTYQVSIADSGGQQASSSVTVFVRPELTVTGYPEVINAGETAQLEALVLGGTPPFTFSWTPVETLNDPLRADPIADPTTTTTYFVTVTDAAGAVLTGSATVTVQGAPSPTPTPTPTPSPTPTPTPEPTPTPSPTPTPTPITASFVFNVLCCPTLNLDASASTGPIVSYTWELSWTASNPDRVTTTPTTSFTFGEEDGGTIRLTVTDAAGNTATATRSFPF